MTAQKIQKYLRRFASKEKAKLLQGFFKTGPGQYGEGDLFIGVRVPVLRKMAREFRELGVVGGIGVKAMEGSSFYALYPESYWVAAKKSGLPADTRVIGIRSIGLGLAAVVAAGLGAAAPVTVRPCAATSVQA